MAVANLHARIDRPHPHFLPRRADPAEQVGEAQFARQPLHRADSRRQGRLVGPAQAVAGHMRSVPADMPFPADLSSEEHTSELQSLMRTSYAVFCLKTKKTK